MRGAHVLLKIWKLNYMSGSFTIISKGVSSTQYISVEVVVEKSDSIVVWGGGAIGGVVAAKLAQAGHPVVLVDIARDHVDAIRKHGLEMIDAQGTSTFTPLMAVTPDELSGTFGRIMLAVKGQHTAQACAALRPHLAEQGWVLALQNGLTEFTIADSVGPARTIGALVNFASDYVGPGRIQFGGQGSLQVGELDGSDSPRSQEAARLLQCVDPNAAWTGRLLGFKWSKVALGSLLFTTALNNETIVEQLSNPHYAPLWRALCIEVVEVARANGVEPAPFDGFHPDAFTRDVPLERSAQQVQAIADCCRRWVGKPRTGVWRDLAVRKRPTEVDPQMTDIVKHGATHGIETPTVRALIAAIREMEQGKRDFGRANLDSLMAGVA